MSKINRQNVTEYFPCFGRYDSLNCYNIGFTGLNFGGICPYRKLCIQTTNKFRRTQKEDLNLDRARLEKE
jgi:hypothetical protein